MFERLKRVAPFVKPIVILALFAIALRVLQESLSRYRYRDIIAYLSSLPIDQVILAIALTLLGYLVMTGYDTLAFEYIRHPLPYRKIALASFIGYAFNNNVGLSGLVGGSLRYRMYTAWRLSAVEIAKVIAFCTLSFWLGFVLLGGTLFIVVPPEVPTAVHLPFNSVRILGILLLLPALAYFLWISIRREPVRVRQWEFDLPTFGLFVAQVTVSAIDWFIAACVLYILLPDNLPISLVRFLSIFFLAQIAGVASNVPGGLGVFEAVVLLFLAPFFPAAAIVGSLVAFRAIYYLIPLIVATILLATHEILEKREGVAKAWRIFGRWAPGIAPNVMAFSTFVGGAVLLISGATPTLPSRLYWLRRIVPLPVVEISHFFGSIAGALLLLIARGLQRRLDAAYQMAFVVLTAGIVLQIFKGGDFEEAIILAIMLFGLVASRRHFYRKGLLVNETFGPGWIFAILLVLISSAWLGFFSYKYVGYSNDLWWRFQFRADAPRFLRAGVGVLAAMLIVAVRHLLRPAIPDPDPPAHAELERAADIVKTDAHSQANLAFLGDKPFLFSDSGRAFIMYGVEGRSWIAMGDPVGPDEEKAELIWKFRERCDVHAAWPVFYEIGRRHLHLYLDLGLTLQKIGEEARVPLEDFSLEGGSRKWMRKMQRKVESEGGSFEIVRDATPILPELREISDAWLAEKKTREKGFSLGFFAEEYIRRFPVAVVRREGRIVAFANIWTSGDRQELSVDLMRQRADAPPGVMDYIFVNLIVWGQQQGYQSFNLGMAPLAGLESRNLATVWNRVGALAYRIGENFYNFQGLRQYKEKFDPKWEPTYLASPGGLVLPRILTNLATLISGGLRGVVAK
ncbi:MAG TPA: bifunctional lysylphosphatidylglycerol flippase/synthetase MprF [Thermoanaerobaculia bacterium]|nr:bifunctional lysylphosphatidylglycerol flippase/synthetase MprF [Thermoanaerobaculia bacterium]